MTPHISIKSVTRQFGSLKAVDSVSLELTSGKIFILMGPNGAGKTTLLRMIAGIIKPTSGTITHGDAARIGVMMQESFLYRDLTPRENIEFYSRLHGVSSQKIDDVSKLLDLNNFFDHEVATLSHGQKQRVSLARALLGNPRILILDEPFLGLDTLSIGHLRDFLTSFRSNGGLAVIATHELDIVRGIADDLVLLEAGKVKYFGTFNI